LILDTDVLIALLKGEKDADDAMQVLEDKGGRVVTTVITAYELLRGAHISSKPKENLTKVQNVLSNLELLDLTLQACEEASKIYRDLRKAGCLIGEFDVLIAAIARVHNEPIMTRDEHFTPIREINVTDW